ncbi:probable arginine--tRNA ligase, mitochondrial [Ctenocephalides felis]|uniref:probable arginine--tRNA ligase, mitochondrial n=1 Tax=Ctenocephalides felis TaxID=7515 RepID=UPI000E6E55C7|nr:probable arginine--tRNA ligase, mitochondrial [Ctenocephalides felis]
MPGRIKSLLSEQVIEHLRKTGLNHPQASIAPFIQIGAYKNNCIELQIPLNKLQHQNFDNFAKTDLFYDVHINTQVKYPYVCFKTSTKYFIKHTLNLQSQLYLRRPKTGHDVIRLNYLGDWGTQFGFLKLGVDLLNINDDEMLSTEDSTISDRAREVFARLEQGGAEDMEKWHLYRTYTVDELIQVYKRLNVEFQEYHWESMYDRKSLHDVIKLLETKNILKTSPDGKKYVELFNRNVTVIKSDGSSLYLSRDIAAALDRHTKYNFDNMYYIVDNAQTDHFVALFETLKQIDTSLYEKCKHVKFGRIRGMSTRKGDVVF